MATTRSSSTLGRRSIVARIAALLALVGCGIAIYLLVMAFTEDGGGNESKGDKKNRSEQSAKQKQAASVTSHTVATGDTLSGIAQETGVPVPRIERLNPELDAEALNAGQVLTLR
jgi:LysM repeat protein